MNIPFFSAVHVPLTLGVFSLISVGEADLMEDFASLGVNGSFFVLGRLGEGVVGIRVNKSGGGVGRAIIDGAEESEGVGEEDRDRLICRQPRIGRLQGRRTKTISRGNQGRIYYCTTLCDCEASLL